MCGNTQSYTLPKLLCCSSCVLSSCCFLLLPHLWHVLSHPLELVCAEVGGHRQPSHCPEVVLATWQRRLPGAANLTAAAAGPVTPQYRSGVCCRARLHPIQ
jgi:hypothetical protein